MKKIILTILLLASLAPSCKAQCIIDSVPNTRLTTWMLYKSKKSNCVFSINTCTGQLSYIYENDVRIINSRPLIDKEGQHIGRFFITSAKDRGFLLIDTDDGRIWKIYDKGFLKYKYDIRQLYVPSN